MSSVIRPAFSNWPDYNRRIRDAVSGLSAEELALQPSPNRWPLWATAGHLACQRVSGLCGLAGEPGAESTPFPDALYRCPGDEYLEPAMTGPELAHALDSTFAVIERVLDTWRFDDLDEVLRRDFGHETWESTRGALLQRTFAHDISHAAELNEILGAHGLPQIDLWN